MCVLAAAIPATASKAAEEARNILERFMMVDAFIDQKAIKTLMNKKDAYSVTGFRLPLIMRNMFKATLAGIVA